MKDNRGVTLVEILATLSLLSIIGLLVWSVFLQGIKNSNAGSTKITLTQEMNYVQAQLRNIHLTSSYYKISTPTTCSIQVEYGNSTDSSEPTFLLLEDSKICYEIDQAKINDIEIAKKTNIDELEKDDINLDDGSFEIKNKKLLPKGVYHSISFDLMLKDKTNERVKVSTRTNLSRLKEEIKNEAPTSSS